MAQSGQRDRARNVRFQGVKQILKFEGVTSAFDQERRFATAVSE
jgi:hypothetical protein